MLVSAWLLCVMRAVGCVFVTCVCLCVLVCACVCLCVFVCACVCLCVLVCACVCLCASGCKPSIPLAPSGLCVGLFHQRYHLLVFYSGPESHNDCRTFQISSSSSSDRFPFLRPGSHFLSSPLVSSQDDTQLNQYNL